MVKPVSAQIAPVPHLPKPPKARRRAVIFQPAIPPQNQQARPVQEAHGVGMSFTDIVQAIVEKIKSLFSCFFPGVAAPQAPERIVAGPRPLQSGECAHTSTVPLKEFLSRGRLKEAAKKCTIEQARDHRLHSTLQGRFPFVLAGLEKHGKQILLQIKRNTFLDPDQKKELTRCFSDFIGSEKKLVEFLKGVDSSSAGFLRRFEQEVHNIENFLKTSEAFLKREQEASPQEVEKFMERVQQESPSPDEQVTLAHVRELFLQPKAALIKQYNKARARTPKLSLNEYLEKEYNKKSPAQYQKDYPRDSFEIGSRLIGWDFAIEQGNADWITFFTSCWKGADTTFLHILRYQIQTIFTQRLFADEMKKLVDGYTAKGFLPTQISSKEIKKTFPSLHDNHPLLCTFHARKEGNTVVLEGVRPFKIVNYQHPELCVGYDAVCVTIRIDLSKKLNPTNPLATPGAVTVREQCHGFRRTLGAIRFK
jgi:hypothetical protein